MDGLFSLLSATEYKGFKVKEWSIVQFSKLGGVLGAISKEYTEKNMDWTSFSTALEGTTATGMLDLTSGILTTLEPFLKHSPVILGISCNLTPAQLDELKYTDGVVLLLLVLKTNIEHLNGFFGSLAAPNSQATTVSI